MIRPLVSQQRMMASIALLSLLMASPGEGANPPKREIRAVWLATAAGLDWPRPGDRKSQQAALRDIVETLDALHFNTIYFQVRPRGDAMYHSEHEPWAESLTGTMGKDPGWDPLTVLIDEAHRHCIEVHAWFNVFKVRSGNTMLSPMHPARKFLEWTVHYQGEDWLDPGFPGVRNYTLTVLLDLVRRYDIDGINFDYARYPGTDFPDAKSFKQYGKGMDHDAWKIQNVNAFIAAAYDSVHALKSWVKVGASPLGVPGTTLDSKTALTLAKYSQDAGVWLQKEKLDYVVPQIYWPVGGQKGQPDFAGLIQRWVDMAGDRPAVAGIAAFKSDVQREMDREIDTARALGASGQSFFRYANIAGPDFPHERYATIALPQSMPWKSSAMPSPPDHIAASSLTPGVFYLEWKPPVSPLSAPWAYVVYRSIGPVPDFGDPGSIAAVLPVSQLSWSDTLSAITSSTYYYAVSTLNRAGIESPASAIVSVAIREIAALRNLLMEHRGPSLDVVHAPGQTPVAMYRLPDQQRVLLEIAASPDTGIERYHAVVVEGEQTRGMHVVPLQALEGRSGQYLVRLQTAESFDERVLRVR